MVFDRPFFVGCIGKIRSIPTKKNIPENLFWYATYSDKTEKWKESTKENKKAKLLIHQDWVCSNLPKFIELIRKIKQVKKKIKQVKKKIKQHEQNQKVRHEVKRELLEVEVKISQETDPEVKDELTSRFKELNIFLRKQSPDPSDTDDPSDPSDTDDTDD